MYERFGATVTGSRVEFKLFFPDNTLDPSQFTIGGSPRIREIRVIGDFQSLIGGRDFDSESAPVMTRREFRCRQIAFDCIEDDNGDPIGWLYTLKVDEDLPDGFYQYKYFVIFENGTTRICSDPCTKITGNDRFEDSAFVIGGNSVNVNPIPNRLNFSELIIYEMMVDDFTAQFRGDRAPIEAIEDRLDHLLGLGINAIEFMPLMGVPIFDFPRDRCPDDFDWGYIPNWLFAVENRYVRNESSPLDRIYKLKALINRLHSNNIHCIKDGVFNHVAPQGNDPNRGFPYHFLYERPEDSPFTGGFQGAFGNLEDLDYNNRCTQQFIFDVCKYWLDHFKFDGIRFDFTTGFFQRGNRNLGITRLIRDLKSYLSSTDRGDIPLMIEHLPSPEDGGFFQSIADTNEICAHGNWFDDYLQRNFDYLRGSGNIDTRIIRILNSNFQYAPEKGPVIYIDNHDHSTIVNTGGGRDRWFKSQPPAIALFTSPGAILLRNGQEFGEDYHLPDNDENEPCENIRVRPRPLRWEFSTDSIGRTLYSIYQRLISIRKAHPTLRALTGPPNVFPGEGQNFQNHFDDDGVGYGAFPDKDVVIFHRFGRGMDGRTEKFIIVINYSDFDQRIDIPLSDNGRWTDLLNGDSFNVTDHRLRNQLISSNFGRILFIRL